jgi:hypothetical protein
MRDPSLSDPAAAASGPSRGGAHGAAPSGRACCAVGIVIRREGDASNRFSDRLDAGGSTSQ